MPLSDGSDLAGYLLGVEAERDAYRDGLTRERAAGDALRIAADEAVQALADQRLAYRELDAARLRQIRAARCGIGFGIGAGYDPVGKELGVTVGLVWRIF